MKLINKTHYESAGLLKIFQKCLVITRFKGLQKIIVTYNRNFIGKPLNYIGGFAGTSKIVIKLPVCEKWNMNTTICEMEYKSQVIAMIFIHEIGHCMGEKHNNGSTIEHLYLLKIKEVFNDEKYLVK